MAEQLLELTEVRAILEEAAKDAAELYKYQIALGGRYGNKNASRRLTDSVSTEVVVDGTAYEVTMSLEEYWKYIEGGSKGEKQSPLGAKYPAHFPPPSVLEAWVNVKPVIPRPDAAGRIPSPATLAFLIGRKIRDYGIEPFPAMEETRKQTMDIYRDRLSEALGHDVVDYIRKVVAR